MYAKWDELTRQEQRVLIQLYGGGSSRKHSPTIVTGLSLRGLVDQTGLTRKGFGIFMAACRQRKVAARGRLAA